MVRNMPDEFEVEKPEPWERQDSWDSWEEKQDYFERLIVIVSIDNQKENKCVRKKRDTPFW